MKPGLKGIFDKKIPTYSFPLMLAVMAEQGIDPDRVLAATDLSLDMLQREDTAISFHQALAFVRSILALSPRSDIGLIIGQHYQISTYGVLGYAMMSCPTWADALALGSRFHRVASSLVGIETEVDQVRGTLAYIARPFYPSLTDIEPFTVEKLFASLIAVSRPLLAEPAVPRAVSLAYPAPKHTAATEAIFECPVQYGSQLNRFELDLDLLQQAPLLANPVSAEMGRKLCEEFMAQYHNDKDDASRQVSRLLLGSPGSLPGMEQVAQSLNMSSRTLRRNLRVENTTFQQITDEVRRELSKRYLKNSRLNLEEIAHLVGFTEPTNFRRAFKRWEGISPRQYRRVATR